MMQAQSNQSPNALFYKVSILLIFSIIVIGSLLDYLINQQEIETSYKEIIEANKPLVHIINERLQRLPLTLWHQEISHINSASNLSISLIEITEFSSNERVFNDLSAGLFVSLYGKDDVLSLYCQISNSSLVLEIETQAYPISQTSRWIPILFYLLIIIVIYLLTRPFTKQLIRLKNAAKQIGMGDFSSRLTMAKSSTLYPIADAFDTMTAEIEKLMHRQRDLTNAVSHELRTPLARLKFAFEELEVKSKNSEMVENINDMRSDVIELEKLIDEMLLYAQANQIKKFEKKQVKVLGLINRLIEELYTDKIKLIKDIGVEINSQTIINADEHLLFRALSNVLRNSISYSKFECRIEVHLVKRNLEIKIIDDGPGIDSKILIRIFEPFVKLDSLKRKSGYGLGLAIAHNIIKKHDGDVRVKNLNPHGACFSIEIPLN